MSGTVRKNRFLALALVLLALSVSACNKSNATTANVIPPAMPAPGTQVGEQPRVQTHLDQDDLAMGSLSEDALIAAGRQLFITSFSSLDGAGRPGSNGAGDPRPPVLAPDNFNRVSGPEANSCVDCHFTPNVGGSGGNSGNIFVLAEALPNVNFDAGAGDNFQQFFLDDVGLERGTPGLFGSGFIELLSREMTTDLLTQQSIAIAQAQAGGVPVTVSLDTKGVNFGSLTANPDTTVDTSAVTGVDADLIIKPFHQKGVVVSLRHFTNTGLNQHHGIQSSERFGAGLDPDGDGMADELTEGDVTAMAIFQATLPAPGRVIPNDGGTGISPDVTEGELLFAQVGCATCHIPELTLQDSVFVEPGPYNPAGNLQPGAGVGSVSVDLLTAGPGPFLDQEPDGTVLVPAYTDLKRHEMGAQLNNEKLVQGGVPTSVFITKKLWGMAKEPPFMHHGRATTIREAILMHGGEAQVARDAFAALPADSQSRVLTFLGTLQTRPPGDPDLIKLIPNPGVIGEQPALKQRVDQADIDAGLFTANQLRLIGGLTFDTNVNTLDGAGRPESRGDGTARLRRDTPENFNRLSGPDSNSCLNCHNFPRGSAGGGIVHNVHVLSEERSFVNFDGQEGDDFLPLFLDNVGNERGTIAVLGSGYIELTSREMTTDLLALKASAIQQAQAAGTPITVSLDTKGVNFGMLTANPDGSVFTGQVEGVDTDLIIKPFRQKGTVVSLRDFTNYSTNRHHGMQSSERFGVGLDPDQDGVVDEYTVGDITALTIYQSLLPVPGRVLPLDPMKRASVDFGETLFTSLGCADCHVPELVLNSPIFTEPGPYNPPGNLQPSDVPQVFSYDLSTNGRLPRLPVEADGTVILPAFTDFKRHDMGPGLADPLVENGVPRTVFLTKKLWGMANEPPFMHHGRALTITEAILMHGGEAQAARDAFAILQADHQASLIDFLNTLQVVPFGSAPVIFE